MGVELTGVGGDSVVGKVDSVEAIFRLVDLKSRLEGVLEVGVTNLVIHKETWTK